MNIKEAAEHLGISVKTLERRIAAGDVSVAYVSGGTGKQRTFDREELDRFKRADEEKAVATTYVARPRVATVAALMSNGNGDTALPQLAPLALIERLTLALESSHAPKVLLTLQEAAELTGLSVNRLRKGIHEGALDGRRIVRCFKVRPSDARAYAEDVFREAKKGYDQNQNNL